VVFDFDRLRATLNRTLLSGGAALEFNGIRCRQIFDLNFGIVDYVDWASCRANETRLPNPIVYTYLKDRGRFGEERELRISLSALGIGKFVLDDRTEIAFPHHLHLDFDFRAAFADNTIREIICGPRCDEEFLRGASQARHRAGDAGPGRLMLRPILHHANGYTIRNDQQIRNGLWEVFRDTDMIKLRPRPQRDF
jgi:hypothetical protein